MRWFYLVFALVLLFLVMFYHQGPNGNANSRLMTVYALVEHGTHQADQWADTTIDYALIDGRFYSDKAPLSSYLVVPFYWLWRRGGGEQTSHDRAAAIHIADVAAAAVPFALYGLMLLVRLRAAEENQHQRPFHVWAVLFVLFGMFLFNYGNCYFGHVLAGFFMVLSYSLTVGPTLPRRLFLSGLTGGLSVLAEYPLALTQLALGLYQVTSKDRRAGLPWYLAGGAAPAIFLFAYNTAITGSPWTFPYSHAANFAGMEHAFALGVPTWTALWGLTFSIYRGAFVFAPLLILLLSPLCGTGSDPRRRSWLVLVIFTGHLVFFASYAYWDGGNAMGPRFLVPAVMLLFFERVPHAIRARRSRIVFAVLGLVGVALNLLAAATYPLASGGYLNPIRDYYWDHLAHGHFNHHALPVEAGLPSGPHWINVWAVLFLFSGLLLCRWWGGMKVQSPSSSNDRPSALGIDLHSDP